ncbi:MAG: class I SAM-dependent methyltransferase [Alphaproteobacteria bacterium]
MFKKERLPNGRRHIYLFGIKILSYKKSGKKKYVKNPERLHPDFYKQNICDYLLYQKHLFAYEYVKQFLFPRANVLEVGCGDGYGTCYINRSDINLEAIDVSKDAIKIAKSKYKNIKFKSFNGKDFNYPDNTFDVILSFQVIEHVESVEQYLKELRRILKPKGLLILTTPDRRYRLTKNQKPWNPFHLREYDLKLYKQDLKKIFPKTEIFSVLSSEEILDIEFNRVKPNRSDYDGKPIKMKQIKDFINKFSVKDFFVEKAKESVIGLDILSVSKK